MKRFALLVGINDYYGGGGRPAEHLCLGSLRFAERDATLLGECLESFGFETKVLSGPEATREEVLTFLEHGARFESGHKPGPQDLFLFSFCGHGEMIENSHCLHFHGSRANSSARTLPMYEVDHALVHYLSCQYLCCIIDACRNRELPGARGAAVPTSDFHYSQSRDVRVLKPKSREKVLQHLYGCEEGYVSWEDENFGHGVLTWHLLRTLRSFSREDQQVTFTDLILRTGDEMAKWRHPHNHSIQQKLFLDIPPTTRQIPFLELKDYLPPVDDTLTLTELTAELKGLLGETRTGLIQNAISDHEAEVVGQEILDFLGSGQYLSQSAIDDMQRLIIWLLEFGEAEPCYRFGSMIHKRFASDGSGSDALKWFRRAAKEKHEKSINMLCMILLDSSDPEDDREAFHWATRGVEIGNPRSMNNLGWLYQKGRGHSMDLRKAEHWYLKSAEQGQTRAMLNLGKLYQVKASILYDHAKSLHWYQEAARSGQRRAQEYLMSQEISW